MNISDIAKIVHEANRQYSLSIGETELEWAKASEDIKEWYLSSVETIIGNPNITAEEIHNSWCKEKYKQAWVYGVVLDTINKLHPYLIEYDKLPDSIKMKDKLMITIVNILKDN